MGVALCQANLQSLHFSDAGAFTIFINNQDNTEET